MKLANWNMALLLYYMVQLDKETCTRREACAGYCLLTTMTLDGVIKTIDISAILLVFLGNSVFDELSIREVQRGCHSMSPYKIEQISAVLIKGVIYV